MRRINNEMMWTIVYTVFPRLRFGVVRELEKSQFQPSQETASCYLWNIITIVCFNMIHNSSALIEQQ